MNKILRMPFFNGVMLGLIIPVVAFLVWHKIRYNSMDLDAFIDFSLTKVHVPATIRMCVFANLPFFLFYNMLKKFEVCMGIFASSILYILVMFGFYFF